MIKPSGLSLLAILVVSSRAAQANQLIKIFESPSMQLVLQSGKQKGHIYGKYLSRARWHVSQWNNPSGDLPDFSLNKSHNSSMSVSIRKYDGHVHEIIEQNGLDMTCSTPHNPVEFDGLLGTNTIINNPKLLSAETYPWRPWLLSEFSSLVEHINVRILYSGNMPSIQRCKLNKSVAIICIVFTNTMDKSTFFYQIPIYGFPMDPRPFWWARGHRNGRYGYNDPISTFVNDMATPGKEVTYNIDVMPHLRSIIKDGNVDIDHNLRDWYISGAYFGSAIWGNVIIKSDWSGYALYGTLQ